MYSFTAKGHENIRATHRNTLEFTKDTHLTKTGDCIVAVNADFEINRLKEFLRKEKIKITIAGNGSKETITATPNSDFSDEKEMVIRITEFKSKRTFATHASKSAAQLNRKLVEQLKNKNTKIEISIE